MPPVWEMSLCAIFYCLKATDATLAFPCAFPSSVIWCETFLLASSHSLITPSADYSVTYSHFLSPSQSSPYLGQSSQLSTISHCLIISASSMVLLAWHGASPCNIHSPLRSAESSLCSSYSQQLSWRTHSPHLVMALSFLPLSNSRFLSTLMQLYLCGIIRYHSVLQSS